LVLSARQSAARGVDLLKVYTNYEIGRRMVEQEQQGQTVRNMARKLSGSCAARLTREFGSGFSKTNLEYMRRFYLAYPGRPPQIAQTAFGQFPVFAIAVLPELVPLRRKPHHRHLAVQEEELRPCRDHPA
jgi:hypothetical protein